MKRITLIAAAAALAFSSVGASAEASIAGMWLRPSTKTLVKFAPCGDSYCGTVMSGEHKGKSIGKMKGEGDNYKGSLTDVAKDKTYTGKAKVNGNTMKLSGCVAGGLICIGENWQRQ